jgi:hypothetical protein
MRRQTAPAPLPLRLVATYTSEYQTDDGALALGDGHDLPRLFDESVPGIAAKIDDD